MVVTHIPSSMSLSFVRPRVLPRLATLSQFRGVAKLSTSTSASETPAASSKSITPATAAGSTTTLSSTSEPTTSLQPQKYRVLRTASQNLPIYLVNKRGGNLKQTRIRKIEGNVEQLRTELQQAFGLEEKEVCINQLTKHINVKGHLKSQIRKFLEDRQF